MTETHPQPEGSPESLDTTIRRGSPFAAGSSPRSGGTSPTSIQTIDPAAVLDPQWGVLRAAIWASAWNLLLGVACLQVFSGGGVIVAALGVTLAVVGLFSSRPIPAGVLLILHTGIFLACYTKMLRQLTLRLADRLS